MKLRDRRPLSISMTVFAISILTVLIFSKYIYMASFTSYYTFYLIEKFGVTVKVSQILLFVFLFGTAAGTLVGGPIGDRIGRKYVIWISILGTAPFSILMPHAFSLRFMATQIPQNIWVRHSRPRNTFPLPEVPLCMVFCFLLRAHLFFPLDELLQRSVRSAFP